MAEELLEFMVQKLRDLAYFVPAVIDHIGFAVTGQKDIKQCQDNIYCSNNWEAAFDYGKTAKYLKKMDKDITLYNKVAQRCAVIYEDRQLNKKVNDFFIMHSGELLNGLDSLVDYGKSLEEIHRYIDFVNSYECFKNNTSLDCEQDQKSIINAYNLVKSVHETRGTDDFYRICEGFFEEMERAVDQGKNSDEKKEYLRKYCNEVSDKMLQNASDLMVVTNA